jgi:hypothetical protein
MVFVPAVAVRVAPPHEGEAAPLIAICKAPGGVAGGTGCGGKVWLKAKPVNGMPALLTMVNVKIAVPGFAPTPVRGLGLKVMVKVGAGTVTVRLIAVAMALGAWLLVRVTGGLNRTPGAVTRRFRLMVQLALAANEPLTSEMAVAPGGAVSVPPQLLLRLLGVAMIKPAGRGSKKARPVSGRADVLVIV